MSMQLTSPDFVSGGHIPARFTCDGDDVSPTLEIRGVPKGALTLALVVYDPDAPLGTFVHWLVWDIPAKTAEIASGTLPTGAKEGLNSAGRASYIGPCPPSGTHNYIFTLYALSEELVGLEAGKADLRALTDAMAGKLVGQTELLGLYSKDGTK